MSLLDFLYKAVVAGNINEVKYLIKEEADLNVKAKNGYTALLWVAQQGHTVVAELLIKVGADLNVKAKNGTTALLVDYFGRIVKSAIINFRMS